MINRAISVSARLYSWKRTQTPDAQRIKYPSSEVDSVLGQDHIPEEITPYPYKFFYWIDP